MELYNETKYLLKKYNITAIRRLGQNFLIDDEVVQKTIDASEITKEDLIIEIGPGLGTLTKPLLERAGKVIAIELDERMINILNDRFSIYNNFELLNDDVLKVDLKKVIEKNNFGKVKIVANLPYYITTPIIMKLLEDKLNIDSIVVMIQKEVADRLIAKPGDKMSGAITYAINYYTNPEKITDVKNSSFMPIPEVDSSVIKLNVLKEASVKVKNEEVLFKVIKMSFMQRRKTLLNSLANGKLLKNKKELEKMMIDLELDLNIRGEKLTLEEFSKISDYIS